MSWGLPQATELFQTLLRIGGIARPEDEFGPSVGISLRASIIKDNEGKAARQGRNSYLSQTLHLTTFVLRAVYVLLCRPRGDSGVC